MAPRAIIIGAPGAGKTSVGRRVADRLGVPFHDSDAAIEKRAGKPVSDIFLSDGEAEFVAYDALALPEPSAARHHPRHHPGWGRHGRRPVNQRRECPDLL